MEDDIYHYDSDGNSTGFSSRRPPKKSLDFSPIILIAIFAIVVACNYLSIYKLIGSYEKYEFPFNVICFNLYWIVKIPVNFLYGSYHLIIDCTRFENLNFLLWLASSAIFSTFVLKICFSINEFIQEKTDYEWNFIHAILSPTIISIILSIVYFAFMAAKWLFSWIFER